MWIQVNVRLAGIGGGGIVSSVWVITAEIVDAQHRAKWSQALSVTWSCSAIAGPLLGGVFSGTFQSNWSIAVGKLTQKIDVHQSSPLSWRWGCECAFVSVEVKSNAISKSTSTFQSASLLSLSCQAHFVASHSINHLARRGVHWHKSLILADCNFLLALGFIWVLNIYRFLFMGGTSCIIIGFGFATQMGCELNYISRAQQWFNGYI